MRSIHNFSVRTAPSTTIQNFTTINNRAVASWAAAVANRNSLIPDTGILKQWRIELTVAPGAAKSYTYELYKNGAATGYQIVISGAGVTSGTNDTELAIAAGDLISMSCTPAGTPAAAGVKSSMIFESSTIGNVPLICGSETSVGATTDRYNAMLGGVNWAATVAGTNVQVMCPSSGTIKNLYISTNSAPGIGSSMTFTVAKNGVDTALVATVSGALTVASDVANSFTVVAGDLLEIHYTIGSGAPGGKIASWGAVFVPNDSTRQPILSGNNDATNVAAENYNQTQQSNLLFTATETNVANMNSINMRLRGLAVKLDTASGGGSWDGEVQKAGVATALTTATINDTVLHQDTTNVVEYPVNTTFTFNLSPNTPTNPTAGAWGLEVDIYVPGIQSRAMRGCGI